MEDLSFVVNNRIKGLQVAITELDIRMPVPASSANLAQQQRDYQSVISQCKAVSGCIGVTIWDFADKVCFGAHKRSQNDVDLTPYRSVLMGSEHLQRPGLCLAVGPGEFHASLNYRIQNGS